MKPPVPVLFLLILCIFAAGYSCAATLTVTKIEDTNDGVCDADCSLREAVAAAVSGDIVVFSTLFDSPQTITLTLGQIAIDKNLTVTGTGQDLVTISGNNANRHFYVTGGIIANLSWMTLRDGNGAVEGVGGAIWVNEGTINVSNANFINNRALNDQCGCGAGGAIWGSENSSFTLSNLIVIGNSSPGSVISGYSIDVRDSLVRQNSGGGISSGETLNIERCLIANNSRGVGAQHLTISDSAIANNTGSGVSGGDSLSTKTIEGCLISGNSGNPTGGGIVNSGTAIIKNSQITNNRATAGWGGGISNSGTLYLINSVVSGNTSSFSPLNIDGGGGVWNSRSLFLVNSTISGNTAGGNPGVGGGIYNYVNGGNPDGHVYLINSTIANNASSGSGGGFRNDASGRVTFSNTIVAENNSTGSSEEDVSGAVTSNGTNLIGNMFGSSGWIGGDLLNVNPMLAPLGNNGGSTLTHALLPDSPAINSGNNVLAVNPLTMLPLKTDQRGMARFVGGKLQTVDIGAYEVSYSSSPITVSGRITTYSGRGIERTRIKLDDGSGDIRYALTNPFGYFRFINLIPGTTYTVSVTHKLYLFTSPQFFTADQNRSDLNFMTGL